MAAPVVRPSKGNGRASTRAGREFISKPSWCNLSIQELRLLQSFRDLPDDERRDSVLQALETFRTAYT